MEEATELDMKLKAACIEEVRAKTEHLRAQAALWRAEAKLKTIEAGRRQT